MYSLTFAFALLHPRSMDEMERRTQEARRFYRRRGESVFAGTRSARHCVRRAVGLVDYRWALPLHSVAIATQPVHQLQISPAVHN